MNIYQVFLANGNHIFVQARTFEIAYRAAEKATGQRPEGFSGNPVLPKGTQPIIAHYITQ